MGNPFLFRRISHYLDTGELLEYDECRQRFRDFRDYARRLEEHELVHTVNLKAQAQWFTRGIRGGRHIRKRIAASSDIDEMVGHLEEMCDHAN